MCLQRINKVVWHMCAAGGGHVSPLGVARSSCLYPQDTEVPFKESFNLSENFEQTSFGYSLAKYKTLILTKEASTNGYNYKNFTACNLYGPYDKFDLENSHVFGATVNKVHSQDSDIVIW